VCVPVCGAHGRHRLGRMNVCRFTAARQRSEVTCGSHNWPVRACGVAGSPNWACKRVAACWHAVLARGVRAYVSLQMQRSADDEDEDEGEGEAAKKVFCSVRTWHALGPLGCCVHAHTAAVWLVTADVRMLMRCWRRVHTLVCAHSHHVTPHGLLPRRRPPLARPPPKRRPLQQRRRRPRPPRSRASSLRASRCA
jgi:hypothetical protein